MRHRRALRRFTYRYWRRQRHLATYLRFVVLDYSFHTTITNIVNRFAVYAASVTPTAAHFPNAVVVSLIFARKRRFHLNVVQLLASQMARAATHTTELTALMVVFTTAQRNVALSIRRMCIYPVSAFTRRAP